MLLRILDSELVTLFGVVDVLLLIEWRFSRKKTALLAGGVTALFALLTAVMVYLGAGDHAIRILYMPSMLAFTFYISRYRDARTFYANCTSALFTVSGSVLGMLAEELFVPAAGVVVHGMLYLLCLLAVYFLFRRPLLAMARELESGWLRLCLVPVILMGALMALTLGYQGGLRRKHLWPVCAGPGLLFCVQRLQPALSPPAAAGPPAGGQRRPAQPSGVHAPGGRAADVDGPGGPDLPPRPAPLHGHPGGMPGQRGRRRGGPGAGADGAEAELRRPRGPAPLHRGPNRGRHPLPL